jgi:uncharacterized peroxidase-related enzyme
VSSSFLTEPEPNAATEALYAGDQERVGYVMNLSRMWAHHPAAHDVLFDLVDDMATAAGLSFRDRGLLISAAASTMGDAYCSLAWGNRLAGASDGATAAGVLTGDDDALDDRERALTRWARQVARDPNATTATDVEALRAVGYDDGQVQAITTFIALRLAFSTVNEALGAVPDVQLSATVDPKVRDVVTWGR